MKTKLAMALGIAVGTVAYQLIRNGLAELDVVRSLVVALVAFAVLPLVPSRWLQKSR